MKKITPEMTVRDINLKYPACRAVFDRYGIGGCGGELGPPETLEFFAKAHAVNLDALIEDLEKATTESLSTGAAPASAKDSLNRLYKLFIRSAIGVTLTFGTLWGVWILTKIALHQSFNAPDYASMQAHGHAQIFGWVGLFIMGVAYHTIPKFKNAALPRLPFAFASLWLMLAGIILRAVAQPLAEAPFFGALNIASAALELVAMAIFVYLIATVFRTSKTERAFYEKFIYTSLFYFGVLGVFNFALVVEMFRANLTVIPPLANQIFLHLEVFGFIVPMIFGYSLRILPTFLGLKETDPKLADTAFYFYNAGVLFYAVHMPFVPVLLELIGVLMLVGALRVFEKPSIQIKIQGVDRSFPWFIKLAYVWLVLTMAMMLGGAMYALATGAEPPHAFVGAYRHAVTVGFITTLMMGVAYRILPIFNGTDLFSHRLMRGSFYLIAMGNLMRVGFQLATLTGDAIWFRLMGLSGYLEFTALALFAINIFKTLAVQEETSIVRGEVTPKTRVADLVAVHPELKETLAQAGLHHIRTLPYIPRFVTLEIAARNHGVGVERLIEAVNKKMSELNTNASPEAGAAALPLSGMAS